MQHLWNTSTVNTRVTDMETCHLRNMESVLSNDKLLESNAAAELSLRAAFNAQAPPPPHTPFDQRSELAALWWRSTNRCSLKYYLTPHHHCEQHSLRCQSQFPLFFHFISPPFLLTTLNTLFHLVLPKFSKPPGDEPCIYVGVGGDGRERAGY